MSLRRVARTVAVTIAAASAAGAFSVLAFTGTAGAAPAEGSSVPNSAVSTGTVTPGTPFSSGQNINVIVPATCAPGTAAPVNCSGAGFPDFSNNTNLNIVECAAPNGVIPTSPTACDGNTVQGNTIKSNADGSVNLQAETGALYTVYALPDSGSLGEGSGGPVCGSTSATECILYIGYNQNDFTAPHVFSQPFFVTANGTDSGANPGDGTPEVPMALLLPLSAMGLLGATVLIRRRRASSRTSASISA